MANCFMYCMFAFTYFSYVIILFYLRNSMGKLAVRMLHGD